MLQRLGEDIRRQELERSGKVLDGLGKKERKSIEAMTKAIVSKLLHNPVITLKSLEDEEEKKRFIEVTARLFDLERNQD
jgi:glutamyl-tRNA reductase